MPGVLSPGQRLRNITIESLLGEGGMGSVWKGRVDIVDMPVAVKVMHPDMAASEQLRLRFLQEARAMASLRHDRIVPLNDFFHEETTGLLVLVMPLMEGRPLDDVFKEHPQGLAVDTALKYAGDALSALAFAHEHGVVHRDVKPSNILVTKDHKIYLMDFGIAKVLNEARVAATQAGATMGTPDYMSPEQIRSPDQLDGRSDMYSLACVLYEMLCGKPPFNPVAEGGARMVAVMTAHLQQAPPPLRTLNPGLPEELERIVMKAMAKDRNQRFGDCREFAEALKNVGLSAVSASRQSRKTVMEAPATVVTPASPVSSEPRAPAPPSNRMVKVAGGAGIVAMMAVGGWMMFGSSPAQSPAQQISVESGQPAPGNPESPTPNPPVPSLGTQPPQTESGPPEGAAPVNTGPAVVQTPQVDAAKEQLARDAAQAAADLEAAGPGNYCNALIRINEAVQLSPRNESYEASAKNLKSLCDQYH